MQKKEQMIKGVNKETIQLTGILLLLTNIYNLTFFLSM